MPLILLIVGLGGLARFATGVRTVDAAGLFASGALIGVSVMRLLYTRRR